VKKRKPTKNSEPVVEFGEVGGIEIIKARNVDVLFEHGADNDAYLSINETCFVFKVANGKLDVSVLKDPEYDEEFEEFLRLWNERKAKKDMPACNKIMIEIQ